MRHKIKKRIFIALLVILLIGLSYGCAAKKEIKVPTDHRRKQMALQRHLKKLNRENEKLRASVIRASEINLETGEVIANNMVTRENIPELKEILEQFRNVNQETSQVLLAYKKSLETDTEKNETIRQMLEGFSAESKTQEERKKRMTEMAKVAEDAEERINVQVGVMGMRVTGLVDMDDAKYPVNGYAGILYLTYITKDNLAFGLRRMNLETGRADTSADSFSTEIASDPAVKFAAGLNILSLGFKIKELESMNLVPQVLYGRGEISAVFTGSPESTATGSATLQGFEIPFYYNFSSGFALGFVISGYRTTSKYTEVSINGQSVTLSDPVETVAESLGFGLNVGAAW